MPVWAVVAVVAYVLGFAANAGHAAGTLKGWSDWSAVIFWPFFGLACLFAFVLAIIGWM